jgi:hypothetical protein
LIEKWLHGPVFAGRALARLRSASTADRQVQQYFVPQ